MERGAVAVDTDAGESMNLRAANGEALVKRERASC
jgi:hypothetical protein